jgi:two-component system sensor histidine kinase AlgZ
MHPAFANRRWFALHVAAWGAAGLVIAFVLRGAFGAPLTGALLLGVPLGFLGGPVALSAWYVVGAAAPGAGPVRAVVTVMVSAIVAAALWASAGQWWWRALDAMGIGVGEPARPGAFAVLLSLGLAGYLLAAASYQAGQTIEATSLASRRALESDIAQRDAELRALRAQLDPHFLFNSLNSIAGLIPVEPARAREMCQLLGDFLRQSLRLGASARIPLSREMALIEQYLRIEQVRFGARLQLDLQVGPDTAEALVPALLLQPLVENAVRHGIAMRLDGGLVSVTSRRAGDRVVIVVANPRDADSARGGTGLGLVIVRRRLAATFGEAAAVAVLPEPESFQVSVTLPYEEQT